jgi:putative methionine-R-sulfoxide reductase with GAF domain
MKNQLTAHDLAVIAATLHETLDITNWPGMYTREARERVLQCIASIMGETTIVEVVHSTAHPIVLTSDT